MPSVSGTGPQLPPERPGFPAPPGLAARRAGLVAAVEAGMFAIDAAPAEIAPGGIRTLRFAPSGASRGTVLHIHGGAFRIGSPETVARFAAALAARCQVTVICPAYRLAPEHPFPAGLSDAWTALRAVASSEQPPLLISGDSAGGAIAAGLAGLSTQSGLEVAGLALLSPWLDLTVANASHADNAATDPLFSAAAAREAAELYLQGLSPRDPLASPQFGQVEKFPPVFVSVGSGEVLLDDALQFADKVRRAGIPVKLETVDGMEHVAITRDVSLPGARQTFDALAGFIDTLVVRLAP